MKVLIGERLGRAIIADRALRQNSLACVSLLSAIILWGSGPVALRYLLVNSSGLGLDPIALLAMRYGIAAIVLHAFRPWRPVVRFAREEYVDVLLCTLLGVIGFSTLVTFGQRLATATSTGLLFATEPLWIALLWALRTRSSPKWNVLVGAALGLLGVSMLDEGRVGASSGLNSGVILIAGGAFCWSAYCVQASSLLKKYGSIRITTVTTTIGAVLFIALTGGRLIDVVRETGWNELGILALLSVGSTVVGTLCWNFGLSLMPGPASGSFLYLIPLVTALGGYVLLDESIDDHIVISGLLILGGVVVTASKRFTRLERADDRR